MDFTLVTKASAFVKILFLCAVVLTAASRFPIEENYPRTDVEEVVSKHRPLWTTNHLEQSIYEEVKILQSFNRVFRFVFWRTSFATFRKKDLEPDQQKVDELVQRLSGDCIIKDLTPTFNRNSHVCYKFLAGKNPFEKGRRFTACFIRRKFIHDPLEWVAEFSRVLLQSCKSVHQNEGFKIDGCETTLSSDLIFSLVVSLYASFLSSEMICSCEWIKRKFYQVLISLYYLFH